ncbi:MAG TPA: GNAT family N-acetyltransferase [Acetobacteraceae bacterium]
MQAEIVTAAERLDQVGPAWERLWQRSDGSVFQSHGWVSGWWAAQGARSGLRLHIGLCWDGEDLAAVIPCVTRRHRGVRVLEWAAKECSDYCDAIAGPEAQDALARTWQAVVAAGGFHVIYLSHVRPGAALPQLFEAGRTIPAGLRLGTRAEQTLQVRGNGLTGAGWFRTLPKKVRNNHTRGKRILEELGTLSIGAVDGPGIAGTLDRMVQFKSTWLDATMQRNTLLDSGALGLRSLVDTLRQRQALQVFSITCGGELVAGLVNIVRGNRAAAFFSAFDRRFDRASPGTVIIVELLLWAFDHGIPEVDFLCGDEPYKFKFANARTELASYVGARTLLGRAALAAGEWADRSRPNPAAVKPARLAAA